MSDYRRYLIFAAFLLLSIAPSSAVFGQSDAHPLLSSQFTVDGGLFFPQSDFEFEVAGSFDTGLAEPIDFEKAYNSSIDDNIASLEFAWRFSNDWSLWGQYMKFDDRVASAVLNEDVQWGDVTFGAGTGIAAGLENSITRVFFGKTLVNSAQSELGVGLGAHIIQVNTFIEGAAIINGNPVGSRRETARTSGALPNLGGWYTHAMSPKLAIRTRIDWLGADIGKFEGHVLNLSLGLNYRVFEHFGVGINYNWLEVDVEVDDAPWRGELLSRSSGLFAYVSAYW